MEEWARERECACVQYLLGGTSLGLKAAILALCRGKEVFVPRHAHGSIYQGIVLAGATPVPLEVEFDPELGIPLGVAPETFQEALCCHPDCKVMVLVHPTYHGITADNATLLQMAHAYGVTTIVDAAHGAHFTSDVCDTAVRLGFGGRCGHRKRPQDPALLDPSQRHADW